MTPSQYLECYQNLEYSLDDGRSGIAHLSRYQSGAFGPSWQARVPILEGVARELNRARGAHHISAWSLPRDFVLGGKALTAKGVLRPYMGKGSPDEVADAIWLAHRFGLITNPAAQRAEQTRTVDRYVADLIGPDCNGFVAKQTTADLDQIRQFEACSAPCYPKRP